MLQRTQQGKCQCKQQHRLESDMNSVEGGNDHHVADLTRSDRIGLKCLSGFACWSLAGAVS